MSKSVKYVYEVVMKKYLQYFSEEEVKEMLQRELTWLLESQS